MVDDKVRNLAEDALNHLVAELSAGKSDALRNYLAAMAGSIAIAGEMFS